MKNTCCVPNCESKRSGVKLHRFPKTETGLKWVQNIKCARLKELSSEELHTLFVCHKHFEKRFVTSSSRLHRSAYSTLFSPTEMDTGIPTQAHDDSENKIVLWDHDYNQTREHEDHSYVKRQPLKELQQTQDYTAPTTSKEFGTLEQRDETQFQDPADIMPSTTIMLDETTGDNARQPHFDYTAPTTSKDFGTLDQRHETQFQDLADIMLSTTIMLDETTGDKARQPHFDYTVPTTSKEFGTLDQRHETQLQDLADIMPSTTIMLDETTGDNARQPHFDYTAPTTSKEFGTLDQRHETQFQDPADNMPSTTIMLDETTGDNARQPHFDYTVPTTSKEFGTLDQRHETQFQNPADNVPSTIIIVDETTGDKARQPHCIPDSTKYINVGTSKKIIERKSRIRQKDLTPRCQRILKEYKKVKKQLNFALIV